MLIGIDGNEANVKERVGVNVYVFELLCAIWKLQNEWAQKHRLIVYLKSPPLSDMPEESSRFKYKVIPGGKAWVLTKLMPDLFFAKPRPDIFFSPNHYIPPLAPMPRICSIMDLGYLEFSGQFKKWVFWQLRYWSAISICISKRVIAISNSTKQDIVRHYPFASKKTFVTPLAYDASRFHNHIAKEDVRRIREKYSIVGDYILFLSTLKPSKNIESLLEAFSSLNISISQYLNIQLVIAGKKGWMYKSIFKKTKDLGLDGRVIFTDFVPEEDKPALIAGSRVFVLPSFWEGFGLDALSAMACGVPVVVSNVGSLPEVVGEAGILIDPNNPSEIAKGIIKVLSLDKEEQRKLLEKGIKQAKKFSWEKTARETVKILEDAAKR